MTREEAISYLEIAVPIKALTQEEFHKFIEALNMAFEVLEQEPCDKYIKEIDHLHKYISKLETQIVMQEPCEDCISREHLLEEIASLKESPWFKDDTNCAMAIRKEAIEIVEDLCIRKEPSVNPKEPKEGHWIDMGSGQECSECREIQYGYDSFRYFCANCGARMKG